MVQLIRLAERGTSKSVLAARHDDDIFTHKNIIHQILLFQMVRDIKILVVLNILK